MVTLFTTTFTIKQAELAMDMEFTLNTSFNITFGRSFNSSFNSSFDSLARRLSKLIITGAIASIIALPVSAQQISAEQMAQFKKLPKAQQ